MNHQIVLLAHAIIARLVLLYNTIEHLSGWLYPPLFFSLVAAKQAATHIAAKKAGAAESPIAAEIVTSDGMNPA